MQNILYILFIVLVITIQVFSQTNEDQRCPKIEVNGPDGIVPPNEPWKFKATIIYESEKYNLQFVWSILEAEKDEKIIEGQGTLNIKVLFNSNKMNRGVFLEVKGMPEGCPNTASEISPITICSIESRLIDEFSLVNYRIEKARLDNLINEILNDPTATAYIIEKFPLKTSKKIIARKLKLISDYISKTRKQDISRFTVVAAESNDNLTQFWIVPSGATPPMP